MKKISTLRSGFTLVEISMVLIVIALMIAGVLGGKALITSSRMHHIGTDLEMFRVGTKMFRDKYQSFPGDMTDAEDILGASGRSAGAGNGDGDGQVGMYSTEPFGLYSGVNEKFLAWQHLALAGFIKKRNYTGYNSNDATDTDLALPELNLDVPAGPFKNTGYQFYVYTSAGVIFLGGTPADPGAMVVPYRNGYFGGFLTPSQMQELDSKIDDGTVRGRLKSGPSDGSDCFLSWDDVRYNVGLEEVVCTIQYDMELEHVR